VVDTPVLLSLQELKTIPTLGLSAIQGVMATSKMALRTVMTATNRKMRRREVALVLIFPLACTSEQNGRHCNCKDDMKEL
jgi:hypothetical protein